MFVRGPQPGLDLLATIVLSPPMKIVEPSDLADPDAAARKLVETYVKFAAAGAELFD